jgi:CubicO group peptidase (beta-lactamase class C family)
MTPQMRIASTLASAALGIACFRAAPAPAPDLSLTTLIDGIMDSTMAAEHIPGAAVVVVQDGKLVLSKGYGFANLERRVPVDPAWTRFRIGSISKALTSLAVLQLVDDNRIALDDPVSRWVKEPVIENRFAEPVRVRHLVTHTAGFDQLGDSGRFTFDRAQRFSIDAFLRLGLRVVRPPGIASSYDTWGMTLAGLLVERVSGMPYAQYMQRKLFDPLGMSSTSVEVPSVAREQLAVGYAYLNNQFVPQKYEYYATTPASGIDATPNDMATLMIALLGDGNRALSKSALRRLATPQFSNVPGIPAYTFGFWEDSVNGERVLSHGGNMLEYEGQLVLIPAKRIGMYVVYNHDGEAGGVHTQLRNTLWRRLSNAWLPPLPTIAAPTPLPIDTKRFAGFYATGIYCHTCAMEGAGWNFDYNAIVSNGPGVITIARARWLAVDSLTFVSESNPRRRLGFQADERGEITRSVIGTDVREKLTERLIDEVLGPDWRSAPTPHAFAARVYRTSEEWSKCSASLAGRTRADPSNGRAWYYGGFCATRARDPQTAIAALTKAIEVGPWSRPATWEMALAQASAGNATKAFEWLEKGRSQNVFSKQMLDREPLLSSLRTDPRFAELKSRMP